VAHSVFYFTDSQAFGGAEQSLFTLMGALDRSAWEPTLVVSESPVASVLADRARSLKVPVRTVPPLPLGTAGLRRLPGFAAMLARQRPDAFHATLSSPLAAKFALAAAVMARIEAVVGTVQLIPPFPLSRSSRVQLQVLVSRMGRMLAVSRAIQRQLIDDLGWPAAKVDVVYNAVAPVALPAEGATELRMSLTGGRPWPVVLVCARLDEQKGHDVLLEAAARLPEVMFILAGDGPERGRLEAQAAALGLTDRVRFLGQRDDVPALLGACDVFALPSLYEGSSLAVLEAMSAGCAVVTSDIPGTNELVIDGQTGLLTPPGDPGALADALRRTLSDPDRRRRLGDSARARVLAEFTADAMARSVTSVYSELLREAGGGGAGSRAQSNRDGSAPPDPTDENALVRTADWRFLLRGRERPVALNLARGRLAKAVPLVADAPSGSCAPDLVVVGRPRARDLAQARAALRPGGEVVAQWAFPRPGGIRATRQALVNAGFGDIRLYWPGPDPSRPQFWLPLGSPAAQAHVLEHRPVRNLRGRLLRLAWQAAVRSGILAPVYALATAPGESAAPTSGPAGAAPTADLDGRVAALLLTGGARAINKAVALEFTHPGGRLTRVIKFARAPEAEPSLSHEAEALQDLARDHPGIPGVPQVLAMERRAGRLGVAESPLTGAPMLEALTPTSFPNLADRVTEWLATLAGRGERSPRADWWERLVELPLATFAHQFGSVTEPGVLEAVSDRLQVLSDLPLVFEHRDCSPWNIVLGDDGRPAVLDWESAESRGLPCRDLVYFVSNAAFILDGALESGRTRATYRQLLDNRTPYGRVADDSLGRYCAHLGLDPEVLPSLRLLTWIVHSRSDFRHLELEGRTDLAALRSAPFLGLVQEELQWSPA
jgi:glycosyltransferase involved in cell wall biosynthesis